jgi:hypothetical protein
MSPRSRPTGLVLLLVAVAAFVLVAGAMVARSAVGEGGDGLGERRADGWRTLTYESVRVEVPGAWIQLDTSDCEFGGDRYGPPDLDPCASDGGLGFSASETFDPAHGPGIRWAPADDWFPRGRWAGYVRQGHYAVYVADADRDVATRVLSSVR